MRAHAFSLRSDESLKRAFGEVIGVNAFLVRHGLPDVLGGKVVLVAFEHLDFFFNVSCNFLGVEKFVEVWVDAVQSVERSCFD